MQFADIQEARDFLAQHPDVHLIELFLIAANGVPRGKARSGRLETASRRRSIFLSTPSEGFPQTTERHPLPTLD